MNTIYNLMACILRENFVCTTKHLLIGKCRAKAFVKYLCVSVEQFD